MPDFLKDTSRAILPFPEASPQPLGRADTPSGGRGVMTEGVEVVPDSLEQPEEGDVSTPQEDRDPKRRGERVGAGGVAASLIPDSDSVGVGFWRAKDDLGSDASLIEDSEATRGGGAGKRGGATETARADSRFRVRVRVRAELSDGETTAEERRQQNRDAGVGAACHAPSVHSIAAEGVAADDQEPQRQGDACEGGLSEKSKLAAGGGRPTVRAILTRKSTRGRRRHSGEKGVTREAGGEEEAPEAVRDGGSFAEVAPTSSEITQGRC